MLLSRMPTSRKWASWLAAAVLFFIIATHYGIWSETFDIGSLTQSATTQTTQIPPKPTKATTQTQPAGLTSHPQSTSQQLACPEPEKVTCPAATEKAKPFLDLPTEYTTLSDEDRLCETFYTEKYIQSIATSSRSLLEANSAVTEFDVPTHPSHRKLNVATPVWLLQGVHWDPSSSTFLANANDKATKPTVYGGGPLSIVTYDANATGCLDSASREVVVYPALWEATFPNIWHRLLEIWQTQLSFDAVRIALKPGTSTPYLAASQIAAANVVLPADMPGPWGDLWKIVTPTPHAALPPSSLSPDVCYDVVVPTVGWASPFWSSLMTSTYETCPRQTLLTTFVNRLFAHYSITPRTPAAIATRSQPPTITVIQRSTSRKFRDFEAFLDKLHARHPESPVNVVDLALLSTRDQIALAHNTDVWVGHHGAGMTYVLFMARTSAVVEILPPLFVSRGFRWLARMRGLVHFSAREMWRVEYEEKYEGKPRPLDWTPERQDDSDADGWQLEEWVNMKHEDILDLVDAAVLSQRERKNDIAS